MVEGMKMYLGVCRDYENNPCEPYLIVSDEVPEFNDRQFNHESEIVIHENIFEFLPILKDLEENQLLEIQIVPIMKTTVKTVIERESI